MNLAADFHRQFWIFRACGGSDEWPAAGNVGSHFIVIDVGGFGAEWIVTLESVCTLVPTGGDASDVLGVETAAPLK